MADTVTSRTIVSGSRNLVMAFTNASDGTGEAAVKKVDASDVGAASLKIMRVRYSVSGMIVTLLEDATTDVRILDLQGDGVLDFTSFGGIPNSLATGYTGDILLTTTGHTAGDSYSLILEMAKS